MPNDEQTKIEALIKAGDELAAFAKGIAESHGWEYTTAISAWVIARDEIEVFFTGWKGGK
jgi:hypothetical protein